ncbi:GLUG motif-containing protein [Paenibacillus koleovorans]|uniref:GLUG motif-containing protein n=1 Tax=Paenibacillus koleovorans TaxID=121608 RepID=UPI000FDC1FDA|nr:ZmpA/ZmpB/ZmpC family metallo-endopeptidase-related protein [Paenibacillus koleovorans]
MLDLLKRKWLAMLMVVILLTPATLPFGVDKHVFASDCVTPGASVACPIMIYDAAGLNDMHSNLTAHYALGNHIDLSGGGWIPVGSGGNVSNAFRGSFNGNGYTIANLSINTNESRVGLFGKTVEATIQNIGLVNVNIKGTGGPVSNVGGLVGEFTSSTIRNAYVTGTVEGAVVVGGLVGYALGSPQSPSYIFNSYTDVEVTGSDPAKTGGLIGSLQEPYVITTDSYYNLSKHASPNGSGLFTAEMKDATSYAPSWNLSGPNANTGEWRMINGQTNPIHRTTYDQIFLQELTIYDESLAPIISNPPIPPLTYSAQVATDVSSVTVAVYKSYSQSSVTIDGDPVESKTITLPHGSKTVNITVTTPLVISGAAVSPYVVNYTRTVIREDGIDYPHRITTASGLAAIGTGLFALNHSYELINDLDLDGLKLGTDRKRCSAVCGNI